VRSSINSTLTYLGILGVDPLLVKLMIPELAFARVCTMRTTTINTVGLVRALCDSCVGWKDGWDGIGIALTAASDPAMFIGHMRAHAMRTSCARRPAGLRRVTPLPAALADRNTFARLSIFDETNTVTHHNGLPNQGLCMGTCLRIPEINIDITIGTVRRVLDKSRVTSKNKMLVERATSQRPLDAIQRDSLSTSVVLKERDVDNTNIRCEGGKTDIHSVSLEVSHGKATDDIECSWVWNLSRGDRIPAISSGHGK